MPNRTYELALIVHKFSAFIGFGPEHRRIDGKRSCCSFNMRCSGQQEDFCTGPKNGRRDIKCRIPIRVRRHTQPGNHLNGGTWHRRPISCSDLLIRCTKLWHDVIGVLTCVTNNMILPNRIRLTFFTNHACPDDSTFQCLRLSNRYLRRAQDPDL